MKKYIKITAVLAAAVLLLCGCPKKNKDNQNDKNADNQTESTIQTEKENDNNEETSKNTEEKEKSEKTKKDENKGNSEVSSENKNEKTGSGLFLGMDDSNLAVIFSAEEKKDVHFKIDSGLDLVNSDVEIGDSVTFTYSTDETDSKTLISIKKADAE